MYNDLLFTVLEFVGNFHIYLKGNVMLHLAKPSTYSVKTKVSFFNFPHFFNHRLYLCVYKKPSVIGQKETFERNLERKENNIALFPCKLYKEKPGYCV